MEAGESPHHRPVNIVTRVISIKRGPIESWHRDCLEDVVPS
jgi:hypothetical protein